MAAVTIKEVRPHTLHSGVRNRFVVEVETSDGLVGVGEAGLGGRELAVRAGVAEHLRPLLIDQDATRIEHLWQLMSRSGFFPAQHVMAAATSAIDIALWDLAGKRLGVPVYELLGGRVRDRVLAYTQVPEPSTEDLDAVVGAVKAQVEAGWRAVRWNLAMQPPVVDLRRAVRIAVEQVAAVRDAVGPEVELILDAHTRLSPAEAVRLCRLLEEHDPLYVEDPLRAENPHAYRRLRQHTAVPLAAGEQYSSKWDFRPLIEEELVDYARIDLCIAGGLTEARKIAAWCETHQVSIAVHNPLGPVSSMAALHFHAATTPAAIVEMLTLPGEELPDVFGKPAVRFADGLIELADAPGLGVAFDADAAAHHPYQRWERPDVRRADGSVTNW